MNDPYSAANKLSDQYVQRGVTIWDWIFKTKLVS